MLPIETQKFQKTQKFETTMV